MGKKALLMASMVLVVLFPLSATATTAGHADLGFESAFPRKIYQKKYFGLAITGVTIVAAGTFSYLTAGAGAPVAATGVSTVASWVAGGGAGSYMAGLSTIGGWFGGNAILGASILNGISLGTIGGVGSWGTLSAGQKALALSGTAATAMDGIAVIGNPSTAQLEWRVILPVPRGLANERIGSLVDKMSETSMKLAALQSDLIEAEAESHSQGPSATPPKKLREALQAIAATKGLHDAITKQVNDEIASGLKSGDTTGNTIVLAVLAHNSGQSSKFRRLLRRIKLEHLERQSYFDYLRAIAALQTGKITVAERLLRQSWSAAKFAVEPAILIASVVGSRGYSAQERALDDITTYADKNFDADAYMPVASLVSLHYRIGAMALGAKRCERALDEFKKAQSFLSSLEKYWTGKEIRQFLEIGEANALYCQNRRSDAYALFEKVAKRAASYDARALLCDQFSGGCDH